MKKITFFVVLVMVLGIIMCLAVLEWHKTKLSGPKSAPPYSSSTPNELPEAPKEATTTTTSTMPQTLSPKQVVERFIEADMAGARIGGEIEKDAPEIRNYIDWKAEPGWDTAMTIWDYEITQSIIAEKSAKIIVVFVCAWDNYETNAEGLPIGVKECQAERQKIIFSLKKEGGKWKIIQPLLRPHISTATFLGHTALLLKDEPQLLQKIEKEIQAKIEKHQK